MLENRSLSRDFLYSLVLVIIFFALSHFVASGFSTYLFFVDPIEIAYFSNLFVTLLGVLSVILTILTVFESVYKDNPAIAALKSRGQYTQIFQRFNDSILALFASVLVLLASQIFVISSGLFAYPNNAVLEMNILGGVVAAVVVFSIIRVYRCLDLFKLLQNAINETNSPPK